MKRKEKRKKHNFKETYYLTQEKSTKKSIEIRFKNYITRHHFHLNIFLYCLHASKLSVVATLLDLYI
jgi:hypothetical protein